MCPINNSNTNEINRGVELMLRKKEGKKDSKTNSKEFGFCKIISLLKREIQIRFYISLIEKE
jgi:hypothetical protein